MKKVAVCTTKTLPDDLQEQAAATAVSHNPTNAPLLAITPLVITEPLTPQRLAVMTARWWGAVGVDLTVGSLVTTTTAFQNLFIAHANAWGTETGANIRWRWTQTSPQVRLAFARDGYWSYVGTDCLSIPSGQPTMNLEGFTERTSDAMWRQIMRHECGHANGCPHEQLRQAIVTRIDRNKAYDYFRRTSGWTRQMVDFNVLTPLEERSIMGSDVVDGTSIMCYSLPASIMKDGIAVPGGKDLSSIDRMFIAKVYPGSVPPPPPPPPPPSSTTISYVVGYNDQGQEVQRWK